MSKTIIKIGDKVQHRGGWGSEEKTVTTIEWIQKTADDLEKDGIEVDSIIWDNEHGDWEYPFVIGLNNGHWAYSYQIKPVGVLFGFNPQWYGGRKLQS